MAIENVKKVVIAGMADDFSGISGTLQRMSMLHIDSVEPIDGLQTGQGGSSLSQAEDNLARIETSIAFLRRYNKKKRGMLEAKPVMEESELLSDIDDALDVCAQAEQCEMEMAKLRSRETQLINLQGQIMPYLALDVRIDQLDSDGKVRYFIGSINEKNLAAFREAALGLGAIEKGLGGSGDDTTIFVAIHKDAEQELIAIMREHDFNQANLSIDGIPREEDEAIRAELAEIRAGREQLEKQANGIGESLPLLERAFDKATVAHSQRALIENAGVTDSAFILNGWVRESNAKKLQDTLQKTAPYLMVEFSDAQPDEMKPTALKNSKLIKPFEAVTNMYSTPMYNEIDPNPIMAPFFFLFFGIMVSDAGYGLLLAFGALAMLRMTKPMGQMGAIVTVVFFGGLSTIMWGAIFGGWFGAELIPKLWFAPLDDPMKMIILSVAMGFVHIIVGQVMDMLKKIKQGNVVDGVLDNIFIIMILVGIALFAVGMSFGLYISLAGVIGIALTAGRHNKGIGKITGGFSEVYGLTGYLSDILSYTRLFGMGLATGVVAMVFNTIATMVMGGGPIGIVFGVLILVVGHVFNLAINALGAYVHACRLQYIEFYNKFFDGNGRAFVPYGYQTKFVTVKRPE